MPPKPAYDHTALAAVVLVAVQAGSIQTVAELMARLPREIDVSPTVTALVTQSRVHQALQELLRDGKVTRGTKTTASRAGVQCWSAK